MKKIITIIIILSSVSILNAQIIPPYLGAFWRFEGFSYVPTSGRMKASAVPVSISGIDITLGKKIFFLGQFGYYDNMTAQNSSLLKPYYYHGFFAGAGVGYYLLDLRNEKGRGHSLTGNLSFTTRFLLDDKTDSLNNWAYIKKYSIPSYTMGGEIMVSYLYNFFKHLALKTSINFGMSAVGFDSPDLEKAYGLGLNYGVSVGLAF